jgi:hypothetical protein
MVTNILKTILAQYVLVAILFSVGCKSADENNTGKSNLTNKPDTTNIKAEIPRQAEVQGKDTENIISTWLNDNFKLKVSPELIKKAKINNVENFIKPPTKEVTSAIKEDLAIYEYFKSAKITSGNGYIQFKIEEDGETNLFITNESVCISLMSGSTGLTTYYDLLKCKIKKMDFALFSYTGNKEWSAYRQYYDQGRVGEKGTFNSGNEVIKWSGNKER